MIRLGASVDHRGPSCSPWLTLRIVQRTRTLGVVGVLRDGWGTSGGGLLAGANPIGETRKQGTHLIWSLNWFAASGKPGTDGDAPRHGCRLRPLAGRPPRPSSFSGSAEAPFSRPGLNTQRQRGPPRSRMAALFSGHRRRRREASLRAAARVGRLQIAGRAQPTRVNRLTRQ